jgi:hypothetical protein
LVDSKSKRGDRRSSFDGLIFACSARGRSRRRICCCVDCLDVFEFIFFSKM